MHSIDLTDSSWLIAPDAKLPVGRLESRIIVDSAHLGRFMGINDLMVEAPSRDINDAAGVTTESGISDSHGLVFTGTPKAADFDKRVSVSVDLSMSGDDAGSHPDRCAHRSGHRGAGGARRQEAGRARRFPLRPA